MEEQYPQISIGGAVSENIKKKYQLLMAAATPNPSRGLFRVLGEWQKRLQGEEGMFKVGRASVGVDAKSDILFTNQS